MKQRRARNRDDQPYQRRKQCLWGLLLIGFGTLVLMGRTDLLDVAGLWHDWPAYLPAYLSVIMVVFGINKLLAPTSAKQVLGGLWLIFLAGWLYVSYEELWGLSFYNSWPALLIAWGVGLVLEPLLSRQFAAYIEEDHDRHEK